MRAIVVGAGIGGLAAASVLDRVGVDVVLVEQAPELTEVGAGITLFPNATKVLDELGVLPWLAQRAVENEEDLYFDLRSGDRVARRQLLGASGRERYGAPTLMAHRADLLNALLVAFPRERIQLGRRALWAYNDVSGVRVRLDNDEELVADVLIAADGIKSAFRTFLFGTTAVLHTGIEGWRALVPRSALPPTHPASIGVNTWLGPMRSVTSYPIRPDLAYVGTFLPVTEAEHADLASWTATGAAEEMRRAFRSSCRDVQLMFDAVEQHAAPPARTSLEFMSPLQSWTEGRIALLGDAAHPIPPSLGQGAALALEDAAVLGNCLKRRGTDNVPRALSEYESLRKSRTSRALEAALAMHSLTRLTDERLIVARNGRLRGLEQIDPTGAATFAWLNGYDALKPSDRQPGDETSVHGTTERPEGVLAGRLWREALPSGSSRGNWVSEREAYSAFISRLPTMEGETEPETVVRNGVPGLSLGARDGPLIFFIHGGNYLYGDARSGLNVASRLARTSGGGAFVPEYRLAPEAPYPAALDDVLGAYLGCRATADAGRPIVVAGEGAGGGLALALALRLKDEGQPLPDLISVVSPFADLTVPVAPDDASARDLLDTRSARVTAAASYVQGADPRQPAASAVFGDFSGQPRLHIEIAQGEAAARDARRVSVRAEAVGTPVDLVEVKASVHSFVLFDFLPESAEYCRRTNEALRQVIASQETDTAGEPPSAAATSR